MNQTEKTRKPKAAGPTAVQPHEEPLLEFVKVHGAGNDFILLPDHEDRWELTEQMVRALCDRHLGIGGDGVIRAGRPRDGVQADTFMDYRNADGSVAEMCGNGVRTIAKWLADRWRPEDVTASGARFDSPLSGDYDVVVVDTRGGTKSVACHRGADGRVATCTVDMGAPVIGDVGRSLTLPDGAEVTVTTLSMGNPHAVILVQDVATAPVTSLGPIIEHHAAFPEGTNVEFIHAPSRDRVDGRIWERGVGETLASGTGSSAMAAAAVVNGLADREVEVHLPGGVLLARWTEETLFITGPAEEVARGHLQPDLVRRAGLPPPAQPLTRPSPTTTR